MKNLIILRINWIFSRKINLDIADGHVDMQTAQEKDYIIGYIELHV